MWNGSGETVFLFDHVQQNEGWFSGYFKASLHTQLAARDPKSKEQEVGRRTAGAVLWFGENPNHHKLPN